MFNVIIPAICPEELTHRHVVQEHREMKPQKGLSAQNEVKIPSQPYTFFHQVFNHQGSKISYITMYGGVFFFHFMPVFQGFVSVERE